MRINDAWNCGNAPAQLLCDAQIGRAIPTNRPDVDLSRQTKIEDLGDHIGRLKIECRLWKLSREHLAQLADITRSRRMPLPESHENHAVVGSDGRAVCKGQVVHTLRYADVVDDELPLLVRDNITKFVFDGLEKSLGGFDSGAGRGANVQLDLSGVDRWKEIAADQHQHGCSQRDNQN